MPKKPRRQRRGRPWKSNPRKGKKRFKRGKHPNPPTTDKKGFTPYPVVRPRRSKRNPRKRYYS